MSSNMTGLLGSVSILGLSLFAPLAFGHELSDVLHATPIETIDSRFARVENVHVEETSKGLVVQGGIRRSSHRQLKLRGHIDIEVLDSRGNLIEIAQNVGIWPTFRSAKHDVYRRFYSEIVVNPGSDYSVRISHDSGGGEHS